MSLNFFDVRMLSRIPVSISKRKVVHPKMLIWLKFALTNGISLGCWPMENLESVNETCLKTFNIFAQITHFKLHTKNQL